ncbi:hypothetical protein [Trichormus sp. NMC-1]|uniref:hypothetical protein n=1 Tax=Trichormus sp. NMC-1 TaxID=1853259 RepID=UPI0008DC1027|nr:hypothetical protein [Trichormus sp. NMC-1]
MNDIESTIEQIKPYLKEIIDSIIKGTKDVAEINLEEIISYVNNRMAIYSEPENIRTAIKYAWNYEEKHCAEYSLEEAIKWFKINLPNQIIAEGCLLKQHQGNAYVLHQCFIARQDNTPLLDGNYPHRIVYTLKMDKALQDQFANKSMLVFR